MYERPGLVFRVIWLSLIIEVDASLVKSSPLPFQNEHSRPTPIQTKRQKKRGYFTTSYIHSFTPFHSFGLFVFFFSVGNEDKR